MATKKARNTKHLKNAKKLQATKATSRIKDQSAIIKLEFS